VVSGGVVDELAIVPPGINLNERMRTMRDQLTFSSPNKMPPMFFVGWHVVSGVLQLKAASVTVGGTIRVDGINEHNQTTTFGCCGSGVFMVPPTGPPVLVGLHVAGHGSSTVSNPDVDITRNYWMAVGHLGQDTLSTLSLRTAEHAKKNPLNLILGSSVSQQGSPLSSDATQYQVDSHRQSIATVWKTASTGLSPAPQSRDSATDGKGSTSKKRNSNKPAATPMIRGQNTPSQQSSSAKVDQPQAPSQLPSPVGQVV